MLLDCMDAVLKEINYFWYMNTWKTIAWHVLCLVSLNVFILVFYVDFYLSKKKIMLTLESIRT
jgi:uncharacterized protein YpmS